MGIENGAVQQRPPRRGAALITPHGDRKPGGSKNEVYREADISLPLMGIKRPGRSCTSTAGSSSSLPSWGSKTRVLREFPQPGLRLIIPHGDRKLALRAVHFRHVLLITPHGDRKCAYRVPSSSSAPHNSLPLMGIESSSPCGGRSTTCPSHYPSWGSKAITDTSSALPPSVFSLPLMGIESDGVRLRGQGVPGLITPHGDRKPLFL